MAFNSGKITAELEFKFENFSTLTSVVGSKTFDLPTDRTKWIIQVYPDGNNAENKGYLSIYLTPKELLWSTLVDLFEFKVISSLKGNTVCRSTALNYEYNKILGFGWPQFISRDRVLAIANGFLVDENLTISCKVVISIEKLTKSKECVLEKQQLLLKSGEFNDCIFVCTDGEVSVNRFLLASQSSVFRAMFKADTEEAKTGKVKIIDATKDVMTVLIEYVSCGTVLKLDKFVDHLMPIADKYEMDDLKEICTKRMCETISKENVCGRLIIANLHNIKTLHQQAIKFFEKDTCPIKELSNSDKLDQELLFEIVDCRRISDK